MKLSQLKKNIETMIEQHGEDSEVAIIGHLSDSQCQALNLVSGSAVPAVIMLTKSAREKEDHTAG